MSLKPFSLALAAVLAFALPALAMGEKPQSAPPSASPIAEMEAQAGHVLRLGARITFETPKGSFTIVTFPQEAPKTVEQVIRLVEEKFYDGLAFHRVEPDFVVQVGDPQTRTLPVTDPKVGRGGSGKRLPSEFEGQSLKHLAGTVGMAHGRDPNSGDSQFYVLLSPVAHLDGAYTIWGQIVDGLDTVRKLEKGDRLIRAVITAKPQ